MQNEDLSRRGFLKMAGQTAVAAAAVPLAPPNREPPRLPIPGPPEKKTGWAIVGLGELALGEILPAFAVSERCRPVALVSGHPDKARKVAAHYGIEPKNIYNYDDCDRIRDNPLIDVVYVVLPNSMHREYTVRALQAGKHVLCEKPMAVTVRDCREMIDAAKKADRKLMIAYRLHYEPYNQAAIEMSRRKEFGPIRMISADNVQNVQAPNIRLSRALGGGPLGDVGVYCLNACRYITGEDPAEVIASQTRPTDDPRFREVPDRVTFLLKFPSGVLAHCSGGFSAGSNRDYRVFCADGWYGLDPAYDYRGLRLFTGKGNRREEITLGQVNHFAREMDHLAHCIESGTEPWTPGEEGLRDTIVMGAVVQSAQSGRVVRTADVRPEWSIVSDI